jgi:hypothetical protein
VWKHDFYGDVHRTLVLLVSTIIKRRLLFQRSPIVMEVLSRFC